jgi:hypothetical protein
MADVDSPSGMETMDDESRDEQKQDVELEDLEDRKNASGPVTTLFVGEENS